MKDGAQTPLYGAHLKLGAKMVPFAGFSMPIQYSSVLEEHKAVRSSWGIFDVSHMGEFYVGGAEATACVEYLITNRAAGTDVGQATYTMMCNAEGGIIDDLIAYREEEDAWILVVNASRRTYDWANLQKVAESFDCLIEDRSDSLAQIAVQGPEAVAKLAPMLDDTTDMPPRFRFVRGTVAGVGDVLIARTGYTGEDGVELYIPASGAETIWTALLDAGATPCGLGARDTLRLEMKYALYGNDISLQTNPYEAGLGWTVKLDKGDFVGREALRKLKEAPRRKLIAFKLTERGIPRQGCPIFSGEEPVGEVTSGTHSPTLGQGIGMGYIAPSSANIGAAIGIEIRGRRAMAEVVKAPFIERP